MHTEKEQPRPFPGRYDQRIHEALDGLRVLIAEQHFTARMWMREQMSVIGATSISLAANASEMMRMARAIPFDIVFCEHHLDEKRDGQQLLEELRFQRILPLRSVFIIATAERKYNHVVAAAEFAPDDYLIKPYTPEQLAVRLDRSLRKKKALRYVFDHMEVNDQEAVIDACDHVIQRTPRYALDALRIKAESLITLGRLEAASAIYESIISTKAVPWARMGYAMILQRQNKSDDALGEAQRLNDEHPEFISVYDMLAKIHEEAGDYNKAMEYLERASTITSSSNTERLRKIADIAEATGDRPKVISTLKRVVERTRKSSMLKVDDYLTLTRSLLAEERVDEATKVANELRVEAMNIQSGEIGTEVAAAMVHRGKGQMAEAKSCLDKVFALFDRGPAETTDTMVVEIAEEAAQHGEAERATPLIARVSIKPTLPTKIKSRLSSWFGSDSDTAGTDSDQESFWRKAILAEQIVQSMSQSIAHLDENWSNEMATNAREKLIDAFTLMPRDKRVIHAHIRYNSIAIKNGGKRHSPTVRTDT